MGKAMGATQLQAASGAGTRAQIRAASSELRGKSRLEQMREQMALGTGTSATEESLTSDTTVSTDKATSDESAAPSYRPID